MDSSSNPSFNSSSKASIILQNDHLSSVRRRNKILIVIFFSLIILLALIIGGIIISLVQKQSESVNPSRAIREFCYPSNFPSFCITSLSSAIKATSNTNPNQVFMLSLEASLKKLSNIISMVSDGTGSEPAFRNCSRSLGHAMGQLKNILEIMRIDPDVETYDQRGDMIAWINTAAEDLAACVSDLGTAESTAADGVRTTVFEVAALVRYSKDFLVDCEIVNQNFRFGLANDWSSSRDEIVENLITVSLFGSQYFVLVLLFCVLLRIY